MPRILSVSYDESLLNIRELMLEEHGYEVVSALGFTEGMKHCQPNAEFDLFILGHSIPLADKQALVQAFRASSPRGMVLALKRGNEQLHETGADFQVDPTDPKALLNMVTVMTKARTAA